MKKKYLVNNSVTLKIKFKGHSGLRKKILNYISKHKYPKRVKQVSSIKNMQYTLPNKYL